MTEFELQTENRKAREYASVTRFLFFSGPKHLLKFNESYELSSGKMHITYIQTVGVSWNSKVQRNHWWTVSWVPDILQPWLLSCTLGSTALIPLHGCVRREHEHFLESTWGLMCYGTNPITAKGKNT